MTGFADEASKSIEGQIKATKTLGWKNIESRAIDGQNIHDLSEQDFDAAVGKLEDAGIQINCFGSAVANWGKQITDPFDITLEEMKRAIPRMQRLGTKLIRVMSFAELKDHGPKDQMEAERFNRLREMQTRFSDAGITQVHENCMNYGGMGWPYTIKLIENVPGLKLVFDTGNPVTSKDKSKPEPFPIQSSWEFYTHVKEHIAYVHIKDAKWEEGNLVYTYPGEGEAEVPKIMADLAKSGYDGGISIEPHMAVIFHDASVKADEDEMTSTYVEYGRKMEKILREAGASI